MAPNVTVEEVYRRQTKSNEDDQHKKLETTLGDGGMVT